MPLFKSISEVVKYNIQKSVPSNSIPQASPLSFSLGQTTQQQTITNTEDGYFRWGIDTWGIGQISGKSSREA